MTVDAAIAVGKSMILSLIDYGNVFLTSLTQKDQADLQKLQNKVLRCCLDRVDPRDMNVVEMHKLVNVEMVDKRTNCLLIAIHRGVQGEKYTMVDHGVNTRFNDGKKINLLKPRNDTVRKSLSVYGNFIVEHFKLRLKGLRHQGL